MSAPREDSRAAIAADLQRWIHQNDPDGTAWFLDEGETVMPGPAPEADSPVAATAREAAPAPDLSPGVPEPADPFAAVCASFVAAALDQIAEKQAEQASPGEPGLAVEEDPLGSSGDAVAALDALRAEVLPCTACGLHETRKHTVFGSGCPTADLMIIGEAPGRDEDLQGEPFVGRSGQLLTKILAAIDLAREDVYIGNILKCRPPENRDPLPPEVLACEPHLRRQLAIIRPRVICCLGRVAAQTLLRTSTSLSRLRGGVHFYQDIPVMATYHPAYLLRNPAAKREAWNDVRKLKALLARISHEGA